MRWYGLPSTDRSIKSGNHCVGKGSGKDTITCITGEIYMSKTFMEDNLMAFNNLTSKGQKESLERVSKA